jgi:hypothetical protein
MHTFEKLAFEPSNGRKATDDVVVGPQVDRVLAGQPVNWKPGVNLIHDGEQKLQCCKVLKLAAFYSNCVHTAIYAEKNKLGFK